MVVAYLYYRPIASWLHTRDALARRSEEVAALERKRASLERALARATTIGALTRQARTMGLVRPGEQLYIVKGIDAWRKAHRRSRS